jgi:hypothetical protein
MRMYRTQVKQARAIPVPTDNVTADAGRGSNELGDYLARRATEFRRTEVQHLIDLGKSDDEIIATFHKTPGLAKFIAGSKAPLTMLRRDIGALRADDEEKSDLEIGLERTRRLTLRQLSDAKLPATAKSRLTQTLAKLEHDLAVARGEARSVPGRGLVVDYDDETEYWDDESPEADESDVEHETDEFDWWVNVDRARRAVHWLPGKGVRREPPLRRGELRIGSVRSYKLPYGMIPWGRDEDKDEGHVIVFRDGEIVGTYKLLADEIPDEYKPIPPPEEQREMREKGYPDHYWLRAKRNP